MGELIELNSLRGLSHLPLWSKLAIIIADVADDVYSAGNEDDGWVLIRIASILNTIGEMLTHADGNTIYLLDRAISERIDT